MELRDHRVLSRPCRVLFAGWETTTTRLQQAGWSLSADQNIDRMTVQLAMRLDPPGLYLISECEEFDYLARNDGLPTFVVRKAFGPQGRVEMMHTDLSLFSPIDARPQFITREIKSIEDFGIFATPLTRTEEIIVEPATVSSLLEQIKKLQSPELAAIRETNRKRDMRGSTAPVAQQRFHAQILSLVA